MSARKLYLCGALLFGAFVLSAVTVGGEEDPVSAASWIAKSAREKGITTVSVLGFTPKGGVGADEAEYISEKMGVLIAVQGKPAVIERTQLEKVLREATLSSVAGGARDLEMMFSVDAVVTGAVFAAGDKLEVFVKLIEVRSGRVIAAARAEEERDWRRQSFPASRPVIRSAVPAGVPADLRDAPSPVEGDRSCRSRMEKLVRLNAELVDEKAGYWAARMREPGFTAGKLTRNPGSEITDPETKVRFYKLLGIYHREGGPAPSPSRLPALMNLMKEEKLAADECGSGPLPGLPPERAWP